MAPASLVDKLARTGQISDAQLGCLLGSLLVRDPKNRERFTQEATVGARVRSDHLVEVVAAGIDEATETPWIAMELLEGDELAKVLEQRALSPGELLEVFRQLCHGLGAAHRAGLVHRDFKPSNVLLGKDDGPSARLVKVLDFGLARAVEHAGSEELSATPESGSYNQQGSLLEAPLTRTGAIMGTPAYMAPEQHEGRPATAQSDQFSFCVSLHEGLYGLHPFDCTTLGTLIAGVTNGRLRDPGALSSRVPA